MEYVWKGDFLIKKLDRKQEFIYASNAFFEECFVFDGRCLYKFYFGVTRADF